MASNLSLQEYCGLEASPSLQGYDLHQNVSAVSGCNSSHNVTPSWRQVVPCFWVQFPVPSTSARVLVLVYYVLVSLLSLSLNGLVILLWLK